MDWNRNGSPGSGRNGGNGATNGTSRTSTSVAGGGGGGYSGGGGGASALANYTGPKPDIYDGRYGIAATGGGGSSYVSGTVIEFDAGLDPRTHTTGAPTGKMGYVKVTFYRC